MADRESSEPNSPQTVSQAEDCRGTENAFNAGDNGKIEANDAILNTGYGAGNPKHTTNGEKNAPKGTSGTKNSFCTGSGGTINLSGATVNSGALAGGDPPPRVTMNIVTQVPVPEGKTVGSHAPVPEGKTVGFHAPVPKGKTVGSHAPVPEGKTVGYDMDKH